jgi:PKD repeat protein
MPKINYLAALLWALPLALLAQVQPPFCATDALLQEALREETLRTQHEQIEQQIYRDFKNRERPRAGAKLAVKTLPVVVHVIHQNGAENIPDAQIITGIQQLNESFSNTAYYDQGSGYNTMIQFCLAKRTPDNQASTGITRNQNALTNLDFDTQDLPLKNINRWKPKEYINIWLVKEICGGGIGCGVAGYAYLPSSHGRPEDGIVMEARWFGSSPGSTGVLSHEMGHYLGLYHTFQGGCQNDDCLADGDKVCDTPPDQSTAWVPCGAVVNSCNTDAQSGFSSDQNDMILNFMDYTDFDCFHDFTEGQSARMDWFLGNVRKTLLESRGCAEPCPSLVNAVFAPSATTIGPGQTVTFSNSSSNAVGYEWTVNGTVFSNAANPSYTFTQVGVYQIELTAFSSDPDRCAESRAVALITVSCPVQADFSVSNKFPSPGELVTVTNLSQNATSYNWFLDGVAQGGTFASFTAQGQGLHIVRLEASNGSCQDLKYEYIVVQAPNTNECAVSWLKNYGSPNFNESAGNIVSASDGNIYVSGSRNDSTVLMALSPSGTLLWTRLFKFSTHFSEQISFFFEDSDKNLVGCGYSSNGFTFVGFTFKYSPAANQVIWAHENPENPQTVNYTMVEKDPGGNYIIFNSYHDSPAPGSNDDVHWVEINRFTGLFTNTKYGFSYGSSEGVLEAKVYNGRVYTCGRYTYGASLSGMRGAMSRFDLQGNNQLSVMPLYPNTVAARNYAPDFTIESDSMVTLIYGDFDGDDPVTNEFALCKTNLSTFTMSWARRYTLPSVTAVFPRTVQYVPDGIVVMAYDASSYSNTYLIKFDRKGNLIWAWNYANFGGFRAEKPMMLRDGDLYLTGTRFGNIAVMKVSAATGLAYADCPQPQPLTVNTTVLQPYRQAVTLVRYDSPIQQSLRPVTPELVSLTETTECALLCPAEICNNDLDDDGDGLIDCFDADCNCQACDGQQASIWYFGDGAGLDFSTEPPTVLGNGQTYSREASAVAVDPFGNLLFYSDGQKVFNRNHQVMPNGGSLFGHPSTTQMLILPQPGKPWRYYVFTPNSFDNLGSGNGTTYSVVDMTLQGGLGDVVPNERNLEIVQQSLFTEKITASRHCNGKDWWILVKEQGNKNFRSYLLNENGLQPPFVSVLGTPPPSPTYNSVGCMKFNPEGNLLINTLFHTGGIDIMQFDQSTGMLSNAVSIIQPNVLKGPYGIEFSSDGKLMYVSSLIAPSKITQFDLTQPPAQIGNGVAIATYQGDYRYGQLQRAPNGKIYVPNTAPLVFSPSLGVINAPDVKGIGCMYQENALPLSPGSANIGLPSFPQDFLPRKLDPKITGPDSLCTLGDTLQYALEFKACSVDSVIWKLSGGALHVINPKLVSAIFDQPGTYTLTALVFSPCIVEADTFLIFIDSSGMRTLDLGPDIALCENGVRVLDAGSGFAKYRWNDGSSEQTLTTLFPGKYWVDVWDNCDKHQSDTIVISIIPSTVLDLGPDVVTCSTLSYTLPSGFASWNWSPATGLNCTDCSPVTVVLNGSVTYTVIAQTADGCLSVDTLNITASQLSDTLTIAYCPGDTLLLEGQSLTPVGDTSIVFTIPGSGACDTVRTYILDEQPLPNVSTTLFLCPGDTLYIDGIPYTEPGFVKDTVPALAGCDTIFNYVLRFAPIPTRADTIGLCPGDTVFIYGQAYTAATTFTLTIPATTGCDTLATYVIRNIDPPTLTRNIAFCPGTSVTIDGVSYSQPGTVQGLLPATVGCDTAVTYILEFSPQPTGKQTILFCPGDTVFIDGQAYTQPGTATGTVPASVGCDTLVTYTLAFAPLPTASKTILFCPGETVVIGGQTYTQPGTVTGIVPAATGCDTLVTYTLQYSSTGFSSTMDIHCPNDFYVDIPPGDSAALVTYPLPTATTDCICPGISLQLQQGLPSGSNFPLGSTDVCYTATDSCGGDITCCFKVVIQEKSSCDVKVIDCVKFELIGITQNAAGQQSYRIRVTNDCAQKMIYFAAQVPDGLVAVAPLNNAVYAAPSGRNYLVRNPNYTPFYSLRFASTTDSIANGQSDVFKYTLPPQADPTYIHVIVRLKDQIYREAHLNTFYCPVVYETSNRPVTERAETDSNIRLYPNPTDGLLYLDAPDWKAGGMQLRVLDNQGRVVFSKRADSPEHPATIRLPELLSSGLYVLDVRFDDGRQWTQRFVNIE